MFCLWAKDSSVFMQAESTASLPAACKTLEAAEKWGSMHLGMIEHNIDFLHFWACVPGRILL